MKTTKINEKILLTEIMRWSDEEHTALEWCFHSLDLDQINECRRKAREIAAKQIETENAATVLTNVFAAVLVRTARWVRLQRLKETDHAL